MEQSTQYKINSMIKIIAKQADIAVPTERINIDNDGFAAACYNSNTIEDMLEALSMDAKDRSQWELTPSAWRENIRDALSLMLWDIVEEIND